jgi:hypothetical protein
MLDTTNYITYYIMLYEIVILYYVYFIYVDCFERLCGYPQGMRRRNNRLKIANLIFGQNKISALLFHISY